MMDDYISRQAAVDTVLRMYKCCDVDDKEMLKDLVLAGLFDLPVREVVLCGECLHSLPWDSDKCRCFLWSKTGIDVFEDGFCNFGEPESE